MNIRREDLLRLSVAERVHLVEEIWDSLVESPDALPVTDAQRRELDRRLEAYERDPSKTKTWSEVREKLDRPE